MLGGMTDEISMDRIVTMLHELTDFKADTSRVDAFRVVLEAYAAQLAQSYVTSPNELTEAHLNSLLTLASQLLDPATVRLRDGEQLLTRKDLEKLAAGDRTTEVLFRLEDLDAALADAQISVNDRLTGIQAQLDALTRTVAARPSRTGPPVPQVPGPPVVAAPEPAVAEEVRQDAVDEALRIIAELRDEQAETRRAQRDKTQAQDRPGCFFNDDGTITCRDCGKAKDPSEYFRDRRAWTGHKAACKSCEADSKHSKRKTPVF